jgi:hypothetical protein
MKVLVIWEWCGDQAPDLYEATGEQAAFAIKAHGMLQNGGDDNGAATALGDAWLFDESSHDGMRAEVRPGVRKLDPEQPCGPFDRIVLTGFVP